MALVLADRVLETTTTTGSGTITLAGAEPGYQSFSAVGNGNQTYYTIANGAEWEVGIGTYTASGTTLSRDTVLSSSANGAKVTLSAGTKNVFVTYPSEKSVNFNVSGDITAATGRIINLGAPSLNSDAATKEYVDNMTTAALHVHEAVVLATPASSGRNDTYNNGTAGVSATLTATANGTLTIDSTVAQAAQRVLIKDCDDQAENGIYVVTTVGNGSTAYVMTRASDADTYGEQGAESLDEGSYFFVTGGTSLKGAAFVCNTAGTITFGTTPITFGEFSQAQVYSAGTGISLTNTVISLVSPVAVATGGTGTTATPTNGQLLIGNGTNYTLSTLTAGSGVSITNSAGSITLSATGTGGTVVEVKATSPLASSGGTSPTISIANSTGTGSVVLDQGATISSATITAGVSAAITTITGTSANITTVTGTTAGFSSANITQLSGTSAGITTVTGTTTTFSSGTITQFGATSATIATVSGTNVTYSNGSFTSATVTTVSGTTATYTSATVTNLNVTSVTLSNLSIASANITTLTGTNLTYTSGTVTNLNSTSANITTLTGTTFGTTATTQLRGASGAITTLTGTTVTYSSGTITNLAATSITVTNTPAFVGNGTLTMNVSGTGLSGSQTFTANQSSNATFTVTSNATSANTASTIVARDASGNFTAGTVTAALAGNATTATTATTANALNTGNNYQVNSIGVGAAASGTAGRINGTTAVFTPNTIGVSTGVTVVNGDLTAYRSGGTTGVVYLSSSGSNYLYWDASNYYLGANVALSSGNYNSYAPTLTGTGASGTWSINVTGSAGSATTATNVSGGGQISAASGTITTLNDGAGLIRSIPSAGTTKTSPYTLATTDNGEHVTVGSGGSITVPNSTFSAGMCVSVYNDTTGGISINISLSTCYVAGTNTNRTGVTLATRGLATILFISSTQGVISGNVT